MGGMGWGGVGWGGVGWGGVGWVCLSVCARVSEAGWCVCALSCMCVCLCVREGCVCACVPGCWWLVVVVECVGGRASTHFIQLLQTVEISEEFPRPIDPFRLDLHLRSRRSVIYRQHQRRADAAYWIYLREEDATVVSTLAFVFDLLEFLHCTRIPITSTWHLRTKRSEAVSLLVWTA